MKLSAVLISIGLGVFHKDQKLRLLKKKTVFQGPFPQALALMTVSLGIFMAADLQAQMVYCVQLQNGQG